MTRGKPRNINRDFGNDEGENELFLGMDTATFGDDTRQKMVELGFGQNNDGSITWGGFHLSPIGLDIDTNVEESDWNLFGEILVKIGSSWDWMVADWLAYGGHVYGDHVYETASTIFGKSDKTWEYYAYVARNVQFSERSENLSFFHHKLVAPHEKEMQSELLDLAESYKLSTRQFEVLIPVYLEGKDWQHLLPTKTSAIDKQIVAGEKHRQTIKKKMSGKERELWVEFARQETSRWQALIDEIDSE